MVSVGWLNGSERFKFGWLSTILAAHEASACMCPIPLELETMLSFDGRLSGGHLNGSYTCPGISLERGKCLINDANSMTFVNRGFIGLIIFNLYKSMSAHSQASS